MGRRRIIVVAAAGFVLAAALVIALRLSSGRAAVERPAATRVLNAAPAAETRAPVSAPSFSANRTLYRALSDAMGAIADSDRVIDQAADSVELTSLVQPVRLASAGGRTALRELLSRAEETAELRLQIAEQNVVRVHDAAQRAPVDPTVTQAFIGGFDAQAKRARAASERLFETQRQAITTGRRLLAFMEDNRAMYETSGEGVTFHSPALQDQFGHYLSQTGQILKRETAMRARDVAARREQQSLFDALNAGG